MDWLFREVSGRRLLTLVVVATVGFYAWGLLASVVMDAFGWHSPPYQPSGIQLYSALTWVLLTLAISCEDLWFRAPLTLAVRCIDSRWATVFVAVASSVLFGYAHGTTWNIPIQGVGGLIFCVVYLRACS